MCPALLCRPHTHMHTHPPRCLPACLPALPCAALPCPQIIFASRTHSQLSQFVGELHRTPFADELSLVALGARKVGGQYSGTAWRYSLVAPQQQYRGSVWGSCAAVLIRCPRVALGSPKVGGSAVQPGSTGEELRDAGEPAACCCHTALAWRHCQAAGASPSALLLLPGRCSHACMQALCINDDVLRLQSASLINERCLELQKPGTSGGSKKAAAVAAGIGGGDAAAVGPQRKVCAVCRCRRPSALLACPTPLLMLPPPKPLLCRLPRPAPAAAAGAPSWLAARGRPPPLAT